MEKDTIAVFADGKVINLERFEVAMLYNCAVKALKDFDDFDSLPEEMFEAISYKFFNKLKRLSSHLSDSEIFYIFKKDLAGGKLKFDENFLDKEIERWYKTNFGNDIVQDFKYQLIGYYMFGNFD